MSLAHEDWKEFDLLSGQLKIADASGSGDVICNAQNGGWVVMCEYDDSNQICYVAGMRDFMAEGMAGGRVAAPEGSTAEPFEFDSESGLVFLIDRRMENKLPSTFKVPEHKLNPDIVEKYGKPDLQGKSDEDKFVEVLFHLGRDHRAQMPSLESLGFGAVCELGKGGVDGDLLYNAKRDVIGFELHRRG